jgi:lipid-binding SYLF domain-containing protein
MISWVMAFAMVALPLSAAEDQKEADRLDNCGTVLKEILDIPDDIPTDLLDKAECVMVIPSVLKFAVGFSGSYGKGAMTCRTGEHFTGPWSAPAMMRLEGGGVGFQLGGQATDFVILVMNPRGAKAILKSKVKLGADARGLFAGVSLEGSTLRQDNGANEKLYNRKLTAEQIMRKGAAAVPPSGQQMIALLNKKSPKNLSDPASLKE